MGSRTELFGIVAFAFICVFTTDIAGDKPCAARAKNVSIVCVCNATYCDDIIRENPEEGRFNVYTSSKGGQRFFKTTDDLKESWHNKDLCTTLLDLELSVTHQTIEGFGGAVSDSAALVWANITDQQLRDSLIESYFGKTGIEYNMVRLPIGSTDFSVRYYSYNEEPQDQRTLTNFTLAEEDYDYKIPMLKAAKNIATDDIHIVSSAWGCPLWMKTKRELSGLARIKEEYYNAFAEYHLKFIERYADQGIPIWGITTGNEPLSGLMTLGHNVRFTWTVSGLGIWISEHLGPLIRNSAYNDVKIMTGDDQRMLIPLWLNTVIAEVPSAADYIDGVAVHFYFDDFSPPQLLTTPLKDYPDKFVLYTESSIGVEKFPHVYFGSWDRARRYAKNIIEDLNYNVVGWIDWNLCLNPEGGPSWVDTKLDAPIIVFAENNEFIKQPMFYALGHFSKFVPRGSQRLAVLEYSPCEKTVDHTSFVTPRNTIVSVLLNENHEEHTVVVRAGERSASVTMPPESIATVEFHYQYNK